MDTTRENFRALLGREFPTLEGIGQEQMAAADTSEPWSLEHRDTDVIAEEIGRVLQLASVAESSLSELEILKSELLLSIILGFHTELIIQSRQGNPRAGAMHALLVRTVASQENLEALLRMTDADIRSGAVRCNAIKYLGVMLETHNYIWSVIMADGLRFSARLILAYAKALEADIHTDNGNLHMSGSGCLCLHMSSGGCLCAKGVPSKLASALFNLKEKHSWIVRCLSAYNWKDILEHEVDYISEEHLVEGGRGCSDHAGIIIRLFYALHQTAVTVLKKDSGNVHAKSFLHNLGDSHNLFRSVLRQIVLGELLLSEGILDEQITSREEKAREIILFQEIMLFLLAFFSCLKLPPMDPETDALVRLARPCLETSRSLYELCVEQRVSDANTICNPLYELFEQRVSDANTVCNLFQEDTWHKMKEESDQDRWDSLAERFLGDNAREDRKERRRGMKKQLAEIHDMCANCFRLESELGDGCRLQQCAKCRQILYCSKDCQVRHWHKIHKKMCKKSKK